MQNINTTNDAISLGNEGQVLCYQSSSDSHSSSSVASLTEFEVCHLTDDLSLKIYSDGTPLFGPNKIEATETLNFSNKSSSNFIFEQSSTEYEISGDLDDYDRSIKIFCQPKPKVVQSKPYDFQNINKVASEILQLTRTARISNSINPVLIDDELNFFNQLNKLHNQNNKILEYFMDAIHNGNINLNDEDYDNFFEKKAKYFLQINKRKNFIDNDSYLDYDNIENLRANHLQLLNATIDFFESILQVAQNHINEKRVLRLCDYGLPEDQEGQEHIGHVGHDTQVDVFEDKVSPENSGHQNQYIVETLGDTDESQPIIISSPPRIIFFPELYADCKVEDRTSKIDSTSLSPLSLQATSKRISKEEQFIIANSKTHPLDISVHKKIKKVDRPIGLIKIRTASDSLHSRNNKSITNETGGGYKSENISASGERTFFSDAIEVLGDEFRGVAANALKSTKNFLGSVLQD